MNLPKMSKKLLFFLLTVLLIVPIFISLILVIIFSCYRNFLFRFYLERKCGQPVQFLRSLDVQYFFDNPYNLIHGNLCLFIKGKANIVAIKKRITDNILQVKDDNGNWKYMKLRQIMKRTLGYFYFVTDRNFSIDNHIFFHENVELKNDNEFHIYLAEIFDKPFPEEFPHWRVVLINLSDSYPGLEPGPHHLMCISGHHSVCDGITVMNLFSHMFDEVDVNNKETNAKGNSGKRLKISFFSRVKELIKLLLFSPGNLFYNSYIIARNNFLHGKKLVGKKFFGFSKCVPLKKVKQIKNRYQATVNDVLMSCIAAGFRSHFLKKGETPTSLQCAIAVALRNSYTSNEKLENNITFTIFSDASDQPTPEKRLKTTIERLNETKESQQSTILYLYALLGANRLPEPVLRMFGNSLKFTSSLSNIPGPTKKQVMLGQEVERLSFFVASFCNTGFGVSVISYNNHVQFGMKADAAFIGNQHDLDNILNNMVMELDNFEIN